MIDYCHREGCEIYTVSRSVDSRPLKKPWYCSRVCKEIATKPRHWAREDSTWVICGLLNGRDYPHLITSDRSRVTCGNCKRTGAWKQAEAA